MTNGRTDLAALRLAAIVEGSDDAIISKDLRGVITSWNRSAERIFGFTSVEAIGQHITLIIPENRRGEAIAMFARVRANEVLDHFETIRRRKDGTLIDISLTISPIRDADGRVIGASKIARDITERKRAEAMLSDLQRRLQTLVTASSSLLRSPSVEDVQAATIQIARDVLPADAYALWRLDAGSEGWKAVRSKGVSDAFAQRLIRLHEAQPVPFTTLQAVEDIAALPQLEGRHGVDQTEGVASMLVFPLTIHGVRSATLAFYWRHAHQFSQAEVRTGEALSNIAASAIAMAELYGAAEYGKQRAAFLAKAGALLASSHDYEKTLAAVVRMAVPYIADWCAVDLLSDGDQLRRVAAAHADPKTRERANPLQEPFPESPDGPWGVQEVIRTGQPVVKSTIHPPTSSVCVPLTAHRRTIGALSFVSAESGRQYTDEDLEFAQDMASRAAMAIENSRSYQQAHEANRLKDEFLATLSHELRTPLNAILGYAKMLSMKMVETEKRTHAVAVIERNANSLRQIIEDVLDVSSIVAGKLRLHVQPVNLPEVIRNAMATIAPAADAKGIQLQTLVDPMFPPISGDPDRLQQVVWNLVANAVKFTPRGGRVQTELRRDDSHAEIVVSDTGRGIGAEFLPHLFERFRQADSGSTRDQGGLGLGLAIVRELVESHGGSVQAASGGPGTGATFTVRLPLTVAHQESRVEMPRVHARAAQPPSSPAPLQRRLDGVSVLAVDDEADARSLLKEILESAGATAITVGSAAEALRRLEQTPLPNVIVADIGMPGMDGLQLMKIVRGLPSPVGRIPAAALTASARSQDRITSLSSGFQLHIAKPVDPAELILAIASLAHARN